MEVTLLTFIAARALYTRHIQNSACSERHVSEAVFSLRPIRNVLRNCLFEVYVRGNGYRIP
jgi:hypothetical protein